MFEILYEYMLLYEFEVYIFPINFRNLIVIFPNQCHCHDLAKMQVTVTNTVLASQISSS